MPVFHSNLLSPDLRNVESLKVGGNKFLGKLFDSNFLLFVCRLERAP
jgi:hypothetical protein